VRLGKRKVSDKKKVKTSRASPLPAEPYTKNLQGAGSGTGKAEGSIRVTCGSIRENGNPG